MIFCVFHVDVYPGAGHGVLGNVYQKIFKNPVSALAVQRENHFFFRKLPPEYQIRSVNFVLQFQFDLTQKTDNINVHNV